MKNYTFANITVRPFLKLSDVNNPYIFGETKHVINMCDYREPEVIELIHSKGGTFDWFPTEEQPMDVNAILQAVAKLAEYDKEGTPIIVHCMGGNNRSRTVVEAYYFAKFGTHFTDEYKGFQNHLIYNCESGYLPPLKEMEQLLILNSKRTRAYLDWFYDQDEQHNYRFILVGKTDNTLLPSTKVKLTIIGRQDYQYGNILQTDENALIIHTDKWLDISEEYFIE